MATVRLGSQIVSAGAAERTVGAGFAPKNAGEINYIATSTGSVNQLCVNVAAFGSADTLKMALYRQSDKALLGVTDTFPAALGINTVAMAAPASVVQGERYCIAITGNLSVEVETDNSGLISYAKDDGITSSDPWPDPWTSTLTSTSPGIPAMWAQEAISGPDYTVRKSSTFDIETTLSGTITTATLNSVNVFDHVTGQVGATVSFAGAATDEITTSGEYDLVLGDGVGTETIAVQVNVYGVAPSNNPLQKDGSALASLAGVQLRVTDGANLNGTELYYSGTGTTDASGNLGNIDLSSTDAADTDPVLLHMRTSAGDSIIASETVGLI